MLGLQRRRGRGFEELALRSLQVTGRVQAGSWADVNVATISCSSLSPDSDLCPGRCPRRKGRLWCGVCRESGSREAVAGALGTGPRWDGRVGDRQDGADPPDGEWTSQGTIWAALLAPRGIGRGCLRLRHPPEGSSLHTMPSNPASPSLALLHHSKAAFSLVLSAKVLHRLLLN